MSSEPNANGRGLDGWSFGRGKTFQGPRGQRHPVIYDTHSVHWRLWCYGRRVEAADTVVLLDDNLWAAGQVHDPNARKLVQYNLGRRGID